MNKPDSLRAHLPVHVPELKHNADRLMIFIDNGKVRFTAAASLSFEYSYDLLVILTDFAGHPDSVIVPLLAWLRVKQSELLENLEKAANCIKFEADLIDRSNVDMSLSLPLTERVVVRTDDAGNVTITRPGEPQRNPDWPDSGAEWTVPHG